MSGRQKIKTKRGTLHIEASAPGYHSATRTEKVEQSMRLTIRLYPRLQQEVSYIEPPDVYGHDHPAWQPSHTFLPTPTLVVGLGGTGRQVLTYVKKNLLENSFGTPLDQVRLAVIDTPVPDQQPLTIGGVRLADEEIVELGADLKPLVERLRREHDPDLSDWFPAEEYARRFSDDELNLANGTRQRRPLSRAMLIDDLRRGIRDDGLDILLLIDCSSSMEQEFWAGDEYLTRLQATKRAALAFLSQIDRLADRVGVISFADDAQEIAPLSNQFNQTVEAIHAISLRGKGTDIGRALRMADGMFAKQGSHERLKVALLLSDGESDAQSTIAAAAQLRQRGVHLITIGIGEAGRSLLEQIASRRQEQPDAFFATDGLALQHIYLQLARQIGQGSQVWRLLRGMASSVIDGDQLRVILVASLAGGFGGAVLCDIAYLLRRVGRQIGAQSVDIQAYLVDAPVFSRVAAARYPTLQANAFATMREIERFQLAQGVPFRMAYDSQAGEHPVLNGTIDWRLLDQIYLFDHIPVTGSTAGASEDWANPELSVFPMIADAICFALDKDAHSASLRQHCRNLESLATTEQWARGRAVTGSMGVCRYILPVHAIFDIFKARWAIRLMNCLLTGETDAQVPLKAEQNQEESVKQLEQHVRLFLLGYAGYDQVPCPQPLHVVGRVLIEGRSVLDEEEAGTAGTNLQSAVADFHNYLCHAVQVMLNGSSIDWWKARTGKAGYVREFLNRLEDLLTDAAKELADTAWGAFTEQCRDKTRLVRQHFLQLIARINADLVETTDHSRQPSLIMRLRALEKDALEHLYLHQRIISHTLLIGPSDVDAFLKDALTAPQPVTEGLSRLYWQTDTQHSLVLTLQTWDRSVLTLGPGSLESFTAAILQLAEQAGRELFERIHFSEQLNDWLNRNRQDSLEVARDKLADQAMIASQPLINFDPHKAEQVRPATTLAVRERLDWLEASLTRRLPTDQQFYPVRAADPYHLLIARLTDVIPVDALYSWQDSRQVYHQWYGLTERGQPDPYAEPTAVFRAEAVALRWEQSLLKELRQAPRLFVPLVVTALEMSTHTRLFALAFASSWMRIGADEPHLYIVLPDTSIQIKLPDLSRFERRPSPYVMGMVYFAYKNDQEHIQAIEQALQTVNLETWRQWTKPDWKQSELAKLVLQAGSPDADDFVAYTAMVVRDELRKRTRRQK